MLVLFSLHIRSKYQEYASFVNTDKRNTIHTSIQTQRTKLKEGSVLVCRNTKICWREIQNKERNLLDESSKDTLLSKVNNNDVWHVNDFWDYLTPNAFSLSFTICITLNNRGKWQNLKQEKIFVGSKRIFKKLSLLFFGVNVNVYKRTTESSIK